MRNEKGFTLIEMMVVMLIISVLLAVTIPNVTRHNENINKKGCTAYKKMIEAEVQAYEMDHNKYPASIEELIAKDYLPAGAGGCPGGKTKIVIGTDGKVTETPVTATPVATP